MNDFTLKLIILALLPIVGLITYGFALIGEPQSVWLWCDMASLC